MHLIHVEETPTDRTVTIGDPHLESPDYLFSNDGAFPQYAFNQLDSKRQGISLHIGAGAMFSLMPIHNLQPYMVDVNPRVIGLNRIIGRAIVSSTTAKQAQEQIIAEGSRMVQDLSLQGCSHDRTTKDIRLNLKADKAVQRTGERHWTKHFGEVKEALLGRPPTYVISDILHLGFTEFMQREARDKGTISLFNATNIHSPLAEQDNSPLSRCGYGMRFLADLPFDENVTVLYSLRGVHRNFRVNGAPFYSLERRAINGISNYISTIHKHIILKY